MKTTINLQNHNQLMSNKHFCKSVSTKIIPQQHCEEEQLLVKNTITFHMDDLEKVIKNFEWRSKTEFPIIKTVAWTLVQISENKAIMEVIHQIFEISLLDLKDIPLFKTLYLLKQSLIGFERLYSRFGSIKITPGMVGVSSHHKCKVWLNQNFASNDPIKTNQDEYGLLRSIFSMFQCRCKKLRSNIVFFEELQKHNTFCSALSFIENYSRENKLNIPCVYQPLKIIESKSHKTSFDVSLKSLKTPSFLNLIFPELINQDENSTYSPINSSQMLNQSNHEDIYMKKSGQTAVDISASNSSSDSFSIDNIFADKKIDEMRLSNEQQQKEIEKGLTKSGVLQFKQKFQTHSRFCRKVGQNYFIHPEHSTSQSGFNKMTGLKNGSSFLEDQSDQISPSKVSSLFNQNKWEQKIGSLFQQNGMKQSIHEGKEPVWKQESDPRKLYLLGNMGKNVTESVIHEQEN